MTLATRSNFRNITRRTNFPNFPYHENHYRIEMIKGIDGIERDSRFVHLKGDNESIRISFFAAPFSIYRKVLKDMPSTTDGKSSLFRWHYFMLKADQILISTETVDGKEVVSASVIPQAADTEQAGPKPTTPNPAKE